jgi:hypothetical protein
VKKSVFLALLAIIFSGCLNYYQEIKFNIDGSGKMVVKYWMKLPAGDTAGFVQKMGIFNKDSVKSEFTSAFTKIENVKVYSDTTDTTTHAEIEFSFTSIDSLNKLKPFNGSEFSFADGAAGQKIFTQNIAPVASGFGADTNSITMTYKYTFPGEIITHNALTSEGKTLTWKYKLSEIGKGKTISVTFRPYKLKETPVWIYSICGAVLLIVIGFLFKKKK